MSARNDWATLPIEWPAPADDEPVVDRGAYLATLLVAMLLSMFVGAGATYLVMR